MSIDWGIVPLFLAGLACLALGIYIGFRTVNKFSKNKVYNTRNAPEFLYSGRPEEWNALRSFVPEWRPDLRRHVFRGLNLHAADFKGALLDATDFSNAWLDDAEFNNASAKNVNFSGASLKRAVFDGADLTNSTFEGAQLDDATFIGAQLDGTQLEKSELGFKSKSFSHHMLWENPELLSRLTSNQLERLVMEILNAFGYEVRRLQASDQGFDFLAIQRNPIGNITYAVECKAYSQESHVGIAAAQALQAVKEYRGIDRAMLVTNSTFSRSARQYALGQSGLQLIERRELLEWIGRFIQS